jgi:putative exporter of polyketide antibiotics
MPDHVHSAGGSGYDGDRDRGGVCGAPRLAGLTPFAHVALVPTQPFRVGAAAIMAAIGPAAALTALGVFRRRDLPGT